MKLFKSFRSRDSWNNKDFIEGAFEGLQMQTSAHSNSWGLGKESQWNVDLTQGLLWFDFSDGKRVTTPIQIVGTYNNDDNTFLWGWDHPSVNDKLAIHANLALEWGKKYNEPKFTQQKVKCSIDDVWKMAAVTNRIAEANGVYKGNSGSTQVFMTFGTIKMTGHNNG